MRKALQLAAVLLALATSALWLATGAHRGWTKTSVPVTMLDEVTGIEGITYDKRFVAGLEILGGAWLTALALAGAALFFRKKPSP